MPVRLNSRSPAENEARIEIIPLIDIMFFLLAAFMLVSLSLTASRSVPVKLPSAVTGIGSDAHGSVQLTVDHLGAFHLDRSPVGANELLRALADAHRTNADLKVFVHGDAEARHGDMIRALDLVRQAGIRQVAFDVNTPTRSEPAPP